MRNSFVALALAASACTPSYSGMPPIAFSDVEYSGPGGEAWPARNIPVPKAAQKFALGSIPEVHVVELNRGAADTLVFVHGLGSNLKFWRYQLSEFAKTHHVVALDMLGYGKSSKPARFPYTMPAMSHVVREVLENLDVKRPVIVGHSMGGQTTLSLLIEDTEFARGAVLVSPAGFEKFSPKDRLWLTRVFSTDLVNYADESGIGVSIRYNNFANWKPDYEWLIEERVRLARAPDFDDYSYANVKSIQGLLETEYTRENLHRIKTPTLIVFGDMDRLIPNRFLHPGHTRDVMVYGAQGIKGSDLQGLPHCGHTVQMDCAEELNTLIRGFLKGLPKETSRAPVEAAPEKEAQPETVDQEGPT
ncbi:MAG: alpha/beta hydrolase [Myxococcota bacterium]